MTLPVLSYPQPAFPEAGQTSEISSGVLWLRMPLPFALDHINLWLLEDGPGWTAVDCGIADETVRLAWSAVLAERQLTRIVVTHFHPDHLGLASWLRERSGAPVWMSQSEYLTAQVVHRQLPGSSVDSMLEFFRCHGLDAAALDALRSRGNVYPRGVPALPDSFNRLIDGDRLTIGADSWQILVGQGHSPEHVSLYCERRGVLISGDMVLPRISTNISVWAVCPEANPLAWFLASLDRLRHLPADTLVLPSHGLPFRGLHRRIAELQAHHQDRCHDLLAACAEPKTAAQLIPVLFSREFRDPHQTMFAMGEAIAHLNYLEQARELTRIVDHGVIRHIRH